MALSENIKTRRKALKMSQEYVAEQLDISRQAVAKWEAGKSEPTTENLVKLAALFEMSVSELVEPENIAEAEAARQEQERERQHNARMLSGRFSHTFLSTPAQWAFFVFIPTMRQIGGGRSSLSVAPWDFSSPRVTCTSATKRQRIRSLLAPAFSWPCSFCHVGCRSAWAGTGCWRALLQLCVWCISTSNTGGTSGLLKKHKKKARVIGLEPFCCENLILHPVRCRF